MNPKVEAAIARETGARVGRPLWADSLGPRGSDGATYVDSIRANTNAIVRGPHGGERCRCHADLDAPVPAARAGRDPAAGRAGRDARRLDRAAPARLLLPRGRHRHLPGARASRGRWRSRRSCPRWPPRSGFGAALERLSRGRRLDAGAATGLLLVAALAVGVVLASDVYESGAGVDRLLFGTLDRAHRSRPVADGGRGGGARSRCTPALHRSWLASGFDPGSARALGVPHRARRPAAARRRRGGGRRVARRGRRAAGRGRARRAGRHRAAGRARRRLPAVVAPRCWPPPRASWRCWSPTRSTSARGR